MLIYINHDDLRSLELMEELTKKGYYVSDQLNDMRYADIVYLGVKGPDRKNRLQTQKDTVFIKDYLFQQLKETCQIFTLIHNDYLDELAKKYHFHYESLLEDEEFLYKNSLLTAEGLLSFLIEHRRFPIYHSQIFVLGYGHCAKPIIDALLALHAEVYVCVRNSALKAEIIEKGCHYMALNELDISQADIVINTIPSLIVKKEHLDHVKSQIMIVDIASYPYGIDHHYALSRGLNSQILSSIPCKYAYGYVGKMMAHYIERKLLKCLN